MPDLFHPITVAIDGNEANCSHRVGSNVYAYQMLCALEKITNHQRKNFHLTILLAQPPVADLPPSRPGFQYLVIGPAKLWTQFVLPLHLVLHQNQYDLFYTPGHYAPRFCPLPYVSSVMDLAFLVYPEQFKTHDLFQLVNWTRYSVKKASKIATISKYSRQEICKFYHRAPEDIVLAYPALNTNLPPVSTTDDKTILQNLAINHPFFLYLGTIQPRKNLIRLLDAFEIFCKNIHRLKNDPQVCLVLAGKNGWLTNEIQQKISASPFAQRIILTGFVTEAQKNALLNKALCTFNLGLYEGFGIPALESLAHHTLPVVAKNTSLPEVIGDCGFKVNPFNTADIAKAMFKVTSLNQKQKNKLLIKADKQIQKFSYDKSANQILTTLLQIYKQQRG